jgi:hypothetical protein
MPVYRVNLIAAQETKKGFIFVEAPNQRCTEMALKLKFDDFLKMMELGDRLTIDISLVEK